MRPTGLTIAKTVAKSIGDLGLRPSGPLSGGQGLLCFAVGYGASGWEAVAQSSARCRMRGGGSRAAGSLEVVW